LIDLDDLISNQWLSVNISFTLRTISIVLH